MKFTDGKTYNIECGSVHIVNRGHRPWYNVHACYMNLCHGGPHVSTPWDWMNAMWWTDDVGFSSLREGAD